MTNVVTGICLEDKPLLVLFLWNIDPLKFVGGQRISVCIDNVVFPN